MCIFFGLKPRLQESSDSFGLVNWWCIWESKKTGHQTCDRSFVVNHLGWLDAIPEMASCVLKTLKLKVFIPPTTALKTRASKGKIEFEAWLLWWKHVFFSPKYRVNSHKTTSVPSLQERAWQESMKASGRCDIRRHFPETFPWMKPKHPTCKHPFIVFSIQAVTCENGWFAKKNRGKNCKNSSQSPRKTGKKNIILVAGTGERVKPWHFSWDHMRVHMESFKTENFTTPNRHFFLSKWEVHGWKWWSKDTEIFFFQKACNMKSFNCCFGIVRMVQRDA